MYVIKVCTRYKMDLYCSYNNKKCFKFCIRDYLHGTSPNLREGSARKTGLSMGEYPLPSISRNEIIRMAAGLFVCAKC